MKYTREILEDAVANSTSIANVMRHLGLRITGGSHYHLSKKIKKFEIDTSHFTGAGHLKGKPALNRKTPNDIFEWSPDYRQKSNMLNRALLESGVEYKCEKCGNLGEWCDEKITLHVDHKDGDWQNNKRENLRFLCPNCHSQTKTFGKRKTQPTLHMERVHKVRQRKKKICPHCANEHVGRHTFCSQSCSQLSRRTVVRPNKTELLSLVTKIGYCATARQYGVSDNAIRKWLK